jgi:ribosome maturation factor RimP
LGRLFIEVGELFAPAFLFDENGVRRSGGVPLFDCRRVDLRAFPEVERDLESQVEQLGYEVVDVQWGGSSHRPVLKLRIDRPDAVPGTGITVDDCAAVSRGLEAWLDEHESIAERYVLEVSSPGVDRPLTRVRDFDRFRGERVALKGHGVLAGRSERLEGELLGLDESYEEAVGVRIKLTDGDEVTIPRSDIRKANLVFTWK